MDNFKGIVAIATFAALALAYAGGVPILAAAKWLLIIGGVLFAVLLAVIFGGVISANRDDNKKKAPNATEKDRETLNKSRDNLLTLRMASQKMKNGQARREMNEICQQVEKIIAVLSEQPDEIPRARQCLNYYLPTLEQVISRYTALENGGVVTSEIAMQQMTFLAQVKTALDKQYKNLFANEQFDLSVDMEAMTIALKRDGLLQPLEDK